MAAITLQGTPYSTNGILPAVGGPAPDFRLVNSELRDITLASFAGRKKLLSIVPSLDTGVCAKTTKAFNGSPVAQRRDVVMLVISADLPFAQARFCRNEKIHTLHTLSMMRDRSFALDYGVLIEDGPFAGVTARAIVVLDAIDTVLHTELVTEIGDEPDFQAALAALG